MHGHIGVGHTELILMVIKEHLRFKRQKQLGTQQNLLAVQLHEVTVGIHIFATDINIPLGFICAIDIQSGQNADVHIVQQALAIAAVKGFQHAQGCFTGCRFIAMHLRLIQGGQLSVFMNQLGSLLPGICAGQVCC